MSECSTGNTFLKLLSTDGFQKYVLQQKPNQLYIESQNTVNCVCNYNCYLSGIVKLDLSNAKEFLFFYWSEQIFTMKFSIVSKFGFLHLCRKKFHHYFLNPSVLRNLNLIYTFRDIYWKHSKRVTQCFLTGYWHHVNSRSIVGLDLRVTHIIWFKWFQKGKSEIYIHIRRTEPMNGAPNNISKW